MADNKKGNTVKENPTQSEPKKKLPELKLNKEWVTKSLPAILLLSGLSLIYIYIANRNIKKLNQAQELKLENKELRSELIAIQTDLMTKSKQSEVANRVKASGLKEMRVPPYQLKKEKK
ncbi:MAG: hypothetical protein J5I91_03320 [Bacteroidetes bacterium]|nr:hypothetical protein [Bacteroidota bacterium]